jgi:hypothetical protein
MGLCRRVGSRRLPCFSSAATYRSPGGSDGIGLQCVGSNSTSTLAVDTQRPSCHCPTCQPARSGQKRRSVFSSSLGAVSIGSGPVVFRASATISRAASIRCSLGIPGNMEVPTQIEMQSLAPSALVIGFLTFSHAAHRPKRSKLQLEVMALAALDHHTVSVTVRRLSPPDRNWSWELASIQPTRSGHGQAQADRCRFSSFDLED